MLRAGFFAAVLRAHRCPGRGGDVLRRLDLLHGRGVRPAHGRDHGPARRPWCAAEFMAGVALGHRAARLLGGARPVRRHDLLQHQHGVRHRRRPRRAPDQSARVAARRVRLDRLPRGQLPRRYGRHTASLAVATRSVARAGSPSSTCSARLPSVCQRLPPSPCRRPARSPTSASSTSARSSAPCASSSARPSCFPRSARRPTTDEPEMPEIVRQAGDSRHFSGFRRDRRPGASRIPARGRRSAPPSPGRSPPPRPSPHRSPRGRGTRGSASRGARRRWRPPGRTCRAGIRSCRRRAGALPPPAPRCGRVELGEALPDQRAVAPVLVAHLYPQGVFAGEQPLGHPRLGLVARRFRGQRREEPRRQMPHLPHRPDPHPLSVAERMNDLRTCAAHSSRVRVTEEVVVLCSAMAHIEGHAGHQTIAALRQFGVDAMFTLNGGHIWPFYDAARGHGDPHRRHPPRAVGDVRRGGIRQADPPARRRRAHRWARGHQRHLGGDVGDVQRVAPRRSRRPRTGGALGCRLAPGVRPRAGAGADHQGGHHRDRSLDRRRRRPRRRAARRPAPSRAGVPRLPARPLRTGRRRRPGWHRAEGRLDRPRRRRAAGEDGRVGAAPGVPRRQRRLLGRRVGRARRGRRAPRGPVLLQRIGSRHVAGPPPARLPPHPRAAQAARRPRRRHRHAARLPRRVRPLR